MSYAFTFASSLDFPGPELAFILFLTTNYTMSTEWLPHTMCCIEQALISQSYQNVSKSESLLLRTIHAASSVGEAQRKVQGVQGWRPSVDWPLHKSREVVKLPGIRMW